MKVVLCLSLLLLVETVNCQTIYARCEIRKNTNAGAPTGQDLTGTIYFEQVGDGDTSITGTISGFDTEDANTKHGFHIHDMGDEGNDCNANGGHYNPTNQNHSSPANPNRHYGDLGNIEEDNNGDAAVDITDNLVELSGAYSVLGRSIVVHAMEDDLGEGGDEESLRTGNAGARLACCVIQRYTRTTKRAICEIEDNTNPDAASILEGLSGSILFEQINDGDTRIRGFVRGFDTGDSDTEHGFHIHEEGDTSNDCNNNAGHYNPLGQTHAAPDAAVRHFGDLGNIVEDQFGNAFVDITDGYVELEGLYSVIERSIVVHAMKDDLGLGGDNESLRTGNAGARLGCCVIREYTEDITVTATCELQDNSHPDAASYVQGLSGTITFTQVNGGDTTITGTVMGFNTSDSTTLHGFHVHEDGDTSYDCGDFGGHYNPQSVNHGAPDASVRHFGDLGNIEEDNSGNVEVDITDSYVQLDGAYSVIGRSIVVHEGEDDLGLGGDAESLRTGNAGRRLACCQINLETSHANKIHTSFGILFTLLIVSIFKPL